MSTRITTRIPVQLRADALALAAERGQSLAEFVRDAIDGEVDRDITSRLDVALERSDRLDPRRQFERAQRRNLWRSAR